jgi:hypothetical protein
MAEAAQRVLMNEFKQLSKEKWTNIEASLPGRVCRGDRSIVAMAFMQSTQLTT